VPDKRVDSSFTRHCLVKLPSSIITLHLTACSLSKKVHVTHDAAGAGEALIAAARDNACQDTSSRNTEGEPLPAEPPPIGADGVVSTDVAAVPTGPPKATIFLRVVNGKDMPKMDFLTGKVDPFVTVTIGGEGKVKTRHIEAELDPVWNEDFTFQIDEDSTKSMDLTVLDWNLTKYTEIGIVIIPIKEIREGKSFKYKV
jgi:hypothetical protein